MWLASTALVLWIWQTWCRGANAVDEGSESIYRSRFKPVKCVDPSGFNGKSKLCLGYSGPAVLDSTVTFYADLQPLPRGLSPKKKHNFYWQPDGDKSNLRVSEGFASSKYDYNFASNNWRAGKHYMHVLVRDENPPRRIIHNKTMAFYLTDSLNGFLKIAGNTGGLIQTEKYSTNETLNFDLDLTDNFYRPVLFTYTWHVNNTLLENQTDSSLSLVLKTPGFCNVSVTVSAQISGVATVMEGTFRVAFFLEDPIQNVKVNGDSEVEEGKAFIGVITCSASAPVKLQLCWNSSQISQPPSVNNSTSNGSCLVTVPQPLCSFTVTMEKLDQSGLYSLNAELTNSVSMEGTDFQVQVVPDKPTGATLAAILVPALFTFCSLFIIAAAVVFHYQVQKRRYVETANFDFHLESPDKTWKKFSDLQIQREQENNRNGLQNVNRHVTCDKKTIFQRLRSFVRLKLSHDSRGTSLKPVTSRPSYGAIARSTGARYSFSSLDEEMYSL